MNLQEEKARLAKEVSKVEAELARVRKKLGNGEFLSKAKEEVILREREKAAQCQEKIQALYCSLERITEFEQSRGKA